MTERKQRGKEKMNQEFMKEKPVMPLVISMALHYIIS